MLRLTFVFLLLTTQLLSNKRRCVVCAGLSLLGIVFLLHVQPTDPGCEPVPDQRLRTDLRSPARAAMIPSSDTPEVSGQCQGLHPAGTPILGPTQPGYGRTPH